MCSEKLLRQYLLVSEGYICTEKLLRQSYTFSQQTKGMPANLDQIHMNSSYFRWLQPDVQCLWDQACAEWITCDPGLSQ